MKMSWLPVWAALVLVGCAPDRTLETLVPRNALAVVLSDHPAFLVSEVSRDGGLPRAALDTGKPWAAVAVPAQPPGFRLLVALAEGPEAWAAVEDWAHRRGGLEAVRMGPYAVLSTPGLPAVRNLDADERFDLDRVRADGDPVAVYLDAANLLSSPRLPPGILGPAGLLESVRDQISGVRIGFASKGTGLEIRLATDWRPSSAAARAWKSLPPPAGWTGWVPAGPGNDGLAVAVSVPPEGWRALGGFLSDPALARRWSSLAPLLGPRVNLRVRPTADGRWSWSAALETSDPLAFRQALKTLVGGGDLQRNFGSWAVDPDTALVYRDRPDGLGGVTTSLTFGADSLLIGYGTDRVAAAGGPDADEALRSARRGGTEPPPWLQEAPSGALAVAAGEVDGLGARGSLAVRPDGNLELRIWTDAAGVRAWGERLPQVLMGWMSGEGGWTLWEP